MNTHKQKKTPQLSPDWSTGIYTGNGVVVEPKAYAISYQNNHSDRRLLTPSFASVELALGYLYTMVDGWHWAVVKTVPHTDQTRSQY